MTNPSKMTKIICTLGPASTKEEVIKELVHEGADLMRLNASHHESPLSIEKDILLVRRVSEEIGKPIGIALDLQGPKIRLGKFKDGSVMLEKGQLFKLFADSNRLGDAQGIGVTYTGIIQDMSERDQVFINDGNIRLTVIKKVDTGIGVKPPVQLVVVNFNIRIPAIDELREVGKCQALHHHL